MEVARIDHVNVRIPADGVEEAVGFYRDVLGFAPENLEAYRAGERTSFMFRCGETALLVIRPVADFSRPDDTNFDHVCLVFDASIAELRETFVDAGVDIERESTPTGSQGRAPAVYVRDPFGYLLECKARG